jgi:DNA polymerase III alpha subunit (gram-positive type)
MMNNRHFFVFDFETGGLDPTTHDPVQVAVQVLDAKTLDLKTSFVSYIKPAPERVSEVALKINNLSLDFLASAPSKQEALNSLLEALRPFGQGLFVAHNAKFDYDFFKEWARQVDPKINLDHYVDYRLICTAQLAFEKWVLHDQVMRRVKLEEITRTFNIRHTKAHDAMSDVEAAGEVLRRALRKSFGFKLARGLRQAWHTRRFGAVADSLESLY